MKNCNGCKWAEQKIDLWAYWSGNRHEPVEIHNCYHPTIADAAWEYHFAQENPDCPYWQERSE